MKKVMKKQYSTVLIALISLLGLSAAARAQEEDKVVAKIPYEFVAAGKTLPAGTYTITRVSPESVNWLEIRNTATFEESAFLLPVTSEASVDDARLSFAHLGDTYYLSRITTLDGVYTLPTPKAATMVAKEKRQDAMSSAGAN